MIKNHTSSYTQLYNLGNTEQIVRVKLQFKIYIYIPKQQHVIIIFDKNLQDLQN